MPIPISEQQPLILGSASPRRRELLSALGVSHLVRAVDVDERPLPQEAAEGYVERIVGDKLAAVQRRVGAEGLAHAAIVVADTTVVVDHEVLGKPVDVADAQRLLSRIAGRDHQVLTRYAIALPDAGVCVARTVSSQVTLRAATADELRRYAESGEGLDKAGAYAVQGLGAFLVRSISGSWSNVVGLPVCELVEDLAALGILGPFPAPVGGGGVRGL
ncbi:MAG TPA: Maf family protein [Polyangiaceae bacterium]|nr:Maf family protein [Polyangiaceae bacterium]